MLEMAFALKNLGVVDFSFKMLFCLKRCDTPLQGETLFSGQYSENNRKARAVFHS